MKVEGHIPRVSWLLITLTAFFASVAWSLPARDCNSFLIEDSVSNETLDAYAHLGFTAAEISNLATRQILILGEGFDNLGLERIKTQTLGSSDQADLILFQADSSMTLQVLLDHLYVMVERVGPGGELRLFGIPQNAIPKILAMIEHKLSDRLSPSYQLLKDSQDGPTEIVLILKRQSL